MEGDYIFVAKYAYGYSKYSFPFGAPMFSGRVFYAPPERGDVVVFRPKSDTGVSYIKRLIGLPGDKIQLKDGTLYINGKQVVRERVEDYVETDLEGNEYLTRQYRETLEKGKSYLVLHHITNSVFDNTPVYEVPANHFFMLGDNRDNSRDSRFLSDVGYIPAENLIGKAEVVLLSFSSRHYPFPFNLNLHRLWVKL